MKIMFWTKKENSKPVPSSATRASAAKMAKNARITGTKAAMMAPNTRIRISSAKGSGPYSERDRSRSAAVVKSWLTVA